MRSCITGISRILVFACLSLAAAASVQAGELTRLQLHAAPGGNTFSGWSEQAPFNVDTTLDDARQWMFREQLPDWLKQAAVIDQQAYAQTLLRYRQAGGEPYSHGVPELLDYARERLAGRLNADFPGSAPAPA